jgi:hypothetical protein
MQQGTPASCHLIKPAGIDAPNGQETICGMRPRNPALPEAVAEVILHDSYAARAAKART